MKSETVLRTSVLSCVIFLYFLAFLQFYLSGLRSELLDWYDQTFYLSILLSLLLSILLFFLRSPFHIGLILLLRATLVLIISYPFGRYLSVELSLLIGLQLEIIGKMPSPRDGVFALIAALTGLLVLTLPRRFMLSGHVSNVLRIPLGDLVLFGFSLVGLTVVIYIIKRSFEQTRKQRDLNEQLSTNIGTLMKANLAFQEYANLADGVATQKERERITREIHDSSGYTFTNLIALMEVAISLGAREPEKLVDLHYQAKRLAQEGLQETRRSLRRLRATEEDRSEGIKSLLKVLKTFEQVTNIRITLSLGNIRWTYGTAVDMTIYRILQEALTNSFRHGKAKTIWVSFWEQLGGLIINIKDDGKGVEKIEKGIGLAGMEERLGQLGGTIEIPNYRDGFHILIRLPIERAVS